MAPSSPAVTVRHARSGDAAPIEEIRVAGWRSAYRGLMPDEVLDGLAPDHGRRTAQLDDPLGTDLVADVDGRVAGWLSYGPARDGDAPPGANEVYACYVAPAAWRGGVGRALMAAALTHLDGDPALLWVLKGNRRAIGFYAAFGFHPDGAERALERPSAANVTAVQGILEVRCRREPEGRVR
ncbi:GNAT family N-acetyltransferase [Nocardiopsis suaedae]|uniref:GNAT family N-acetyltransferase n=1 Tax=Nocardiopsis suaedae TaxID=3018444 RepID=A0ABT4TKA1_9ACTN|nr:GNAT family N-acetyltransferase [Nocardiopsis suaedae]MDA2805021.1 GNAT family N-acetyltransferase [Nocardiopsis suaedae]